jgi:hypothetical protein
MMYHQNIEQCQCEPPIRLDEAIRRSSVLCKYNINVSCMDF